MRGFILLKYNNVRFDTSDLGSFLSVYSIQYSKQSVICILFSSILYLDRQRKTFDDTPLKCLLALHLES